MSRLIYAIVFMCIHPRSAIDSLNDGIVMHNTNVRLREELKESEALVEYLESEVDHYENTDAQATIEELYDSINVYKAQIEHLQNRLRQAGGVHEN